MTTTTTRRLATCPSWCADDDHEINIDTRTGLPFRDHVSAEGLVGGAGAGYIIQTEVIDPDRGATPREVRIFLDDEGVRKGLSPARAREVAADLLHLADKAEGITR